MTDLTAEERRERFAGEVARALEVYRGTEDKPATKSDRIRATDAIRLRVAVEIRERRRSKGIEQSSIGFIDDDEVPPARIAEVLENASDAADAFGWLTRVFKLFGAG